MESDKLDTIIKNQEILNNKLNNILILLYENQSFNNCQMFIQGLTLTDVMNNTNIEREELNR